MLIRVLLLSEALETPCGCEEHADNVSPSAAESAAALQAETRPVRRIDAPGLEFIGERPTPYGIFAS
jgi:hypothetical protein